MPYKIYAAEIERLGPPGIVITTSYKDHTGYPVAESIFLAPGVEKPISFVKIGFPVKEFDESAVSLDDEFMFEKALMEGRQALAAYIEAHYKDSPDRLPPEGPMILESDIKLLIHTWTSDHGQAFEHVYRNTRELGLREELIKICHLPVLQKQMVS